MIKLTPKNKIPINKSDCEICDRKYTCNCFKNGLKECPMICIGCGTCLCDPDKKECCIEGHYVYNDDYVMCVECWKKHGIR